MKRYNNYRHTRGKPITGRKPRVVGSMKPQDRPINFAQGNRSVKSDANELVISTTESLSRFIGERSVPEEAESMEHGEKGGELSEALSRQEAPGRGAERRAQSAEQGLTSNQQLDAGKSVISTRGEERSVTKEGISHLIDRDRNDKSQKPATSPEHLGQPAAEKSAPVVAEINKYVSVRRQIAIAARELENSRKHNSRQEEARSHQSTERKEKRDRSETLATRNRLPRVHSASGKLSTTVGKTVISTKNSLSRDNGKERSVHSEEISLRQPTDRNDSSGKLQETSNERPATSYEQQVPSTRQRVFRGALSEGKSKVADPTGYVRSMPAFRSFVVSTIRRLMEEQRFLSAEPESSRFLARELGVEMWSEGQRAGSKEERVDRSSIPTRNFRTASNQQPATSNQEPGARSQWKQATRNGYNQLNRERFALMEAMINAKMLYSNMRIRW